MSLLSLDDIHKSYSLGQTEHSVLHGIHLSIEVGERIAIMGASGSGKSTLMNLMGLLDVPSQGQLIFLDRDASTLNEDERAHYRNQHIGFVFQQFYLLPRLNALQNVCLPLQYRDQPVEHQQAMHYLERMGVADKAHHRPNELSGGQQQRVAIARALVGQPSLILADEPTGALDSKTGDEILSLFTELNEQLQTTMVIVTHDPNVAKRCHRVIHIADGRLTGDVQ